MLRIGGKERRPFGVIYPSHGGDYDMTQMKDTLCKVIYVYHMRPSYFLFEKKEEKRKEKKKGISLRRFHHR